MASQNRLTEREQPERQLSDFHLPGQIGLAGCMGSFVLLGVSILMTLGSLWGISSPPGSSSPNPISQAFFTPTVRTQARTIPLPKQFQRDTLTLSGRFPDWPRGRIMLAGIPFEFDDQASFIETQIKYPNDPDNEDLSTRVTIPIGLNNPRRVYILMNLSYGCIDWAPAGSTVGHITFVFSGGSVTQELKTGYNIREWVVDSDKDPVFCSVVKGISAPNVQKEVWSAVRNTGKKAVMDLFVFDVPSDHAGQKLNSIVIDDTSTSTVGFENPGILIFGLTVLSD